GLKKINISGEVELLNDPNMDLTIDEVQSIPFKKNTYSTINIGYNNTIDWFKFSVYNPNNQDGNRIIQVSKFLVDTATIYYKENDKWQSITTGAHIPGEDRTYKTYSSSFPATLIANDTLTFYLRIISTYSRQFNISIVKEETLIKGDLIETGILSLFVGGLLIITIFNFFIGQRVKDKVYFHYILANIATGITVLAIRGFLSYHLPGGYAHWSPYIVAFPTVLYVITCSNFSIRFLDLRNKDKVSYYLMIASSSASFISAMIVSILRMYGKQFHHESVVYANFSFSVIAIYAGIMALRKGSQHAKYYLAGWICSLTGLMVMTLMYVGAFSSNIFTNNFYVIGVLCEVLLLAFALTDRYRILQKEKDYLEYSLTHKKNDLSQVIIDNRLRQSFKAELLEKLKLIYKNNDNNIKSQLGSFIADLNIQFDADEKRSQLQENIDKVNSEFEEKLKERFPQLTKSEIEILGYIKLKLTTKEIANIRKVSPNTVKVTKHRINKKLEKEGISIDDLILDI
ncbi:MAG: LuxR C-terminal-related transcriptional regulator, partial [Bacteroidales bacterium]|nr:LuxR C-terminal-related transcriptional regulator [Bacteroidales bacterium]